MFGVMFGLMFGLTFGVTFGRLLDWFLLGLPARLMGKMVGAGRMTWLPLPGVQRELEVHLGQDWIGGIRDINHLLAYTMQFIPAVQAVNAAFAGSPV